MSSLAQRLTLPEIIDAAPENDDAPQPVESRWLYERGSPTTYWEYIEKHPYRQFQKQYRYRTPERMDVYYLDARKESMEAARKFGVFVNSMLYDQISNSIVQYINDLESSGWRVVLYTTEGGAHQEFKELIVQEYEQGMVGCILVGDIPIAWFEDEVGTADGWQIDLYYGDMDGIWIDHDGNGLFDQHVSVEGDRAPEIWVMRLYATTLDGDEVELMKNYFRKNHAYRKGSLSLPRRALDYVDDDWSTIRAALDYVYDDVTLVNNNQVTIAEDYRQRLTEGYSLIRLWAHSAASYHGFRDTPDQAIGYAHCYVHSPVSQPVQLRLGSDDGTKVWLNGINVFTFDASRGHQFDANNVDVSLEAGWNQILIKVSDEHGNFGFSARLSDSSGNNLPNLTYQLNDPSIYGTEAPFIRSWLLNGFYHMDRNWYRCLDYDYLGVEENVDPEEGEVNGDYAWRRITSSGIYINLNTAYPEYENPNAGISYAFVRIYSPKTQAVELWLGSDDAIKVWLNGENVHTVNELKEWTADEDKVQVILNSGWNRLLIKINEWYGEYGFSARFSNPDGTEVEGLRYNPIPEPVGYIRDWLCNGWYKDPNDQTRLEGDYLGQEATVMPSENDTSGGNEWIAHYSPEDYIDLNNRVFAKSGGNVDYNDVLAIDPPCFFYDLWCCGTRYCYEPNYLGGWYIFANSHGLASWGLLYPTNTFYKALGEGKCLGEAQLAYLNEVITKDSYGWAGAFGMYGDPTLVPAIQPVQSIVYVDCTATGACDGTSWTNAYHHLQDALISSWGGDEIRVAAGVYKPDEGFGLTSGDRTATFQIKNGVIIKGGYAGTSAVDAQGISVDPNLRDIEKYETILSGNIGYQRADSDNSYHVVSGSRRISKLSILDGFTITDGYADGDSPHDCGAGLYNNMESHLMLINCTFKNNKALSKGGGLYNSRYSDPNLHDCTFIENTADIGGGMYIHYSSPVLTNCSFTGNTANQGAGMRNYAYGEPILKHCMFIGNSATGKGGGLLNNYSGAIVTNCIFAANSAKWGGGVFNGYSQAIIMNCTFSRNVSQGSGGGISNWWENDVRLTNCILWDDTPDEIHVSDGNMIVTYSDVAGEWLGEGQANTCTDPLFADPDNGDYHLKSETGRWDTNRQSWIIDIDTSPCIDAGDPASPVGDEPFPNGGIINMGAYGGTAEASKSPTN